MNAAEHTRCDGLSRRHLSALKLQGRRDRTIEVYARAVRRVAPYDECCPARRTTAQRAVSCAALGASPSWRPVTGDRTGLQCCWQHVLQRDGQRVERLKAPKVHALPALLTLAEGEPLRGATRNLRSRVVLLATSSMGRRLGETLAVQVGESDGQRQQGHSRRGTGQTARLVPLPELTSQALRALWGKPRPPHWLFPRAVGSPARMRSATTPMERGGTPAAMQAGGTPWGMKKQSRSTPCGIAAPPLGAHGA